jgi:N-formylglutamate amidohydrolase
VNDSDRRGGTTIHLGKTMDQPIWQIQYGEGPLVAAALHDGHQLRPEVETWMALDDAQRLREEDPFTAQWTCVAATRIVAFRSRFEVDLNRPRESAVYRTAEDAWGLHLWKSGLPEPIRQRSLLEYDAFYATTQFLLERLVDTYGRIVVFDLHSYNHRRQGPAGAEADPSANPQVNVGTGTMVRQEWAGVVDRCIDELRASLVGGRPLDVRENVRFRGGQFPRWVHETFPRRVCAIALEVKKFFMDEWTAEPNPGMLKEVESALRRAATGVIEELEKS